jgi:hypothetical protein
MYTKKYKAHYKCKLYYLSMYVFGSSKTSDIFHVKEKLNILYNCRFIPIVDVCINLQTHKYIVHNNSTYLDLF